MLCSRFLRVPVVARCLSRLHSTTAGLPAPTVPEQAKKLFAVVAIAGKQFKVTRNDVLMTNKLTAELGRTLRLEKVLLVGSTDFTVIGTPLIEPQLHTVTATVLAHQKAAKVIVFKKKRRNAYARRRGLWHGHRQPMSIVRIDKIEYHGAIAAVDDAETSAAEGGAISSVA